MSRVSARERPLNQSYAILSALLLNVAFPIASEARFFFLPFYSTAKVRQILTHSLCNNAQQQIGQWRREWSFDQHPFCHCFAIKSETMPEQGEALPRRLIALERVASSSVCASPSVDERRVAEKTGQSWERLGRIVGWISGPVGNVAWR